jgi:hypothetical protein
LQNKNVSHGTFFAATGLFDTILKEIFGGQDKNGPKFCRTGDLGTNLSRGGPVQLQSTGEQGMHEITFSQNVPISSHVHAVRTKRE